MWILKEIFNLMINFKKILSIIVAKVTPIYVCENLTKTICKNYIRCNTTLDNYES